MRRTTASYNYHAVSQALLCMRWPQRPFMQLARALSTAATCAASVCLLRGQGLTFGPGQCLLPRSRHQTTARAWGACCSTCSSRHGTGSNGGKACHDGGSFVAGGAAGRTPGCGAAGAALARATRSALHDTSSTRCGISREEGQDWAIPLRLMCLMIRADMQLDMQLHMHLRCMTGIGSPPARFDMR
jgi:hypothetical protein